MGFRKGGLLTLQKGHTHINDKLHVNSHSSISPQKNVSVGRILIPETPWGCSMVQLMLIDVAGHHEAERSRPPYSVQCMHILWQIV
jgi:hypothetical protein